MGEYGIWEKIKFKYGICENMRYGIWESIIYERGKSLSMGIRE
jgi:hypothetical protein